MHLWKDIKMGAISEQETGTLSFYLHIEYVFDFREGNEMAMIINVLNGFGILTTSTIIMLLYPVATEKGPCAR